MVERVIERFGYAVADATFWVIIIFSIAVAINWAFGRIVDYLLKDVEVGVKKVED